MYFDADEHISIAQKKIIQSERLISVVKRVYDNVPTYRQKMDEIGLKPQDITSIDDIAKLPFTTKHDLRENYPFGMFAVPQKDIVRLHASSGTTGKLTVVGYTKKDIDVWADCCARALIAIGCDDTSTIHVAYGYGLFTGGLGMHYGAEKIGATTVPASAGNTARQIMLIKDFKADTICCTPSYAIFLADEIRKMGLTPADFSLKRGLFGAEPWTNEMRLEIEAKLGIKAYDIYGLSEISGPGVAFECEEQNGSHINDDYFYPEIVDKDTLQPLPYGEKGELVFTTLVKEGIPLIRYRTRDIASLDNATCACGRTGVKLTKIKGRSDDMLIIRGVNVFPSQIESVIMTGDRHISPHYHINIDRVNNIDVMEMELELDGSIGFDEVKEIEELKRNLTNDIASAIGISAKIKLVSEGSIARSEGKAQRVTDNRKLSN